MIYRHQTHLSKKWKAREDAIWKNWNVKFIKDLWCGFLGIALRARPNMHTLTRTSSTPSRLSVYSRAFSQILSKWKKKERKQEWKQKEQMNEKSKGMKPEKYTKKVKTFLIICINLANKMYLKFDWNDTCMNMFCRSTSCVAILFLLSWYCKPCSNQAKVTDMLSKFCENALP